MKKLLFIALLLPFAIFAQLDHLGNLAMTPAQEDAFVDRYRNHPNSFPFYVEGFSNEIGHIKRGAAEFFRDMETLGPGNDRGGWYPTADMIVNGVGNNPFQPYGNNYGEPRTLQNIHFAALEAFAEKDIKKAEWVYRELVFLSNVSFLDFSNQAVFDRTERGYQNPVFMVFGKMNAYRYSLGIIHELVRETEYYNATNQGLHTWFQECADWGVALIDNTQAFYYLTTNWEAESGMTARTSPTQDYHAYYAADGTTGFNESGTTTINTANNRIWNVAAYVGGFGVTYGITSYQDKHYEFFKKTIQIGVFPDGTFWEHARSDSYQGGAVGALRSGIDYVTETLKSIIDGAHEHEVAVARGFLPSSEKGKYYEYTSAVGPEDLFTNWAGLNYEDMGGTQRGLKAAIDNLSQWYRTPANGGFKGQRYSTDGVAFDPVEQGFSLPIYTANLYYQDSNLNDFAMFNTDKGYPKANPFDKAFAAGYPASFHFSIGASAAQGGLAAFGNIANAFGAAGSLSLTDVRSGLEGLPQSEKLDVSAIKNLPPNTDSQSLTFDDATNTLTITGGNNVEIPLPPAIGETQYGGEILQDPSFEGDGSAYTGANGILTNTVVSGGDAVMTIVSNSTGQILQNNVPFVDGLTYDLTINFTCDVAGARVLLQDNNSNAGGLTSANGLVTSVGGEETRTITFTANANSGTLRMLKNVGTDFVWTMHSWSVRENQGVVAEAGLIIGVATKAQMTSVGRFYQLTAADGADAQYDLFFVADDGTVIKK